ncbi:hypothetical protein MZO42_00490 [Sphingomonas psychrotolerans]|uniref:Uncharacterized protein n=1 Tax=Sphingomonas psychrotolerans TaxID=1327635 RepID=A0ABU3MY59_9SPHN|nr:hypothetical protein [Sphingomonas psychrotolerans]MDT8757162.1 hypothetical protein [Sphingomonas psychrotolerans]
MPLRQPALQAWGWLTALERTRPVATALPCAAQPPPEPEWAWPERAPRRAA